MIDAEEITARNAVTLADVVRLTPGVQVRDAGGPGQIGTLRIRGLRSDAAAVLVDGVRLRDAASTQGDITGFFSNLGVVDFDRVEVLRGSASSLYGTNAVGGAINIVTREGGPQRSEGQLEFGSLGHSRGPRHDRRHARRRPRGLLGRRAALAGARRRRRRRSRAQRRRAGQRPRAARRRRRASASASTDRTIASTSTRARPPAACRPPTSRTPRSSTRLRSRSRSSSAPTPASRSRSATRRSSPAATIPTTTARRTS